MERLHNNYSLAELSPETIVLWRTRPWRSDVRKALQRKIALCNNLYRRRHHNLHPALATVYYVGRVL